MVSSGPAERVRVNHGGYSRESVEIEPYPVRRRSGTTAQDNVWPLATSSPLRQCPSPSVSTCRNAPISSVDRAQRRQSVSLLRVLQSYIDNPTEFPAENAVRVCRHPNDRSTEK